MKKKKVLLLLFFFFLELVLNISQVYASSTSTNLSFSMETILPDNQYNKDVTYFDILVKPNEIQKLQLKISNISKSEETIRIVPTNATTNSGGLVNYSKQDKDYKYDDTLKIKFTSLVSGAQEVKIGPGKSEIVSFDFKAPSRSFDGIILGGFVAQKVEKYSTEKKTKSVSFVNKFEVVQAVKIQNNDKKVNPKLTLNDVKPTLYNYRTAVSANIQNETPVLLKNVEVTANISKSGSTKILKKETRKDVELAPNSNFDFPILWGNDPLKAGDYSLDITIIADKKEFSFKKDFKISREDSYNINKKAMDLKGSSNTNLIWTLILITMLLIIAFLFVYILKKKKKKGENNRKHKNIKKRKKKKKIDRR